VGVYYIRFLQIGQYTLKIEAPGFQAQSFGPLLSSWQAAQINASLTLQGEKSLITVDAGLVPLLNTENGSLGTTLDTTAIASLHSIRATSRA